MKSRNPGFFPSPPLRKLCDRWRLMSSPIIPPVWILMNIWTEQYTMQRNILINTQTHTCTEAHRRVGHNNTTPLRLLFLTLHTTQPCTTGGSLVVAENKAKSKKQKDILLLKCPHQWINTGSWLFYQKEPVLLFQTASMKSMFQSPTISHCKMGWMLCWGVHSKAAKNMSRLKCKFPSLFWNRDANLLKLVTKNFLS